MKKSKKFIKNGLPGPPGHEKKVKKIYGTIFAYIANLLYINELHLHPVCVHFGTVFAYGPDQARAYMSHTTQILPSLPLYKPYNRFINIKRLPHHLAPYNALHTALNKKFQKFHFVEKSFISNLESFKM